MKQERGFILLFGFIFMIFLLFGFFVQSVYFKKALPYEITPPEIEENIAPVFFMIMVGVSTIIFILLIKYKLMLVWKVWLIIALTICAGISISIFISQELAFLSAFLMALLFLKEDDLYLKNIFSMFCFAGVSAIFIPIFSIYSIIILLILISIYDVFSVYISGHMKKIAKEQEKEKLFLGLIVEKNGEIMGLGGGDIVLPIIFAGTAGRINMVLGYMSIYGAVFGLILLSYFGQKKKMYPAMPAISAGILIFYSLSSLLLK